jgi:uncharacterized membrane protein YeaQ/YmgE (transglycosylase-associated protein family)
VVKGRGYGGFRDIILGIVGAIISGMVMSLFGIHGQAGFLGSIIIAFIGAILVVAVVRALGV